MHDLIIIGAGPAGITASVYAARKRLNTLVISPDIGGQAAWSGDIENYTGYQFISGPELAAKFEEHMRKFDIQLKENEFVVDLNKSGEIITVKTNKGEYQAKAVIVASGKRTKELSIPGEKEYKNKGLSYCATCDGPLFFDKSVAVIGGGNSALDAAAQLVRIAKEIYIINISSALTGDEIIQESMRNNNKVKIYNDTRVLAVLGGKMVTGIKILRQNKEELLPVEGVFVEIGLLPNTDFAGILEKNESNEIIVNANNETSVEGIFAAGDVTNVPEKQIIIAAGEGSKACLGVFHYLSRHKFNS